MSALYQYLPKVFDVKSERMNHSLDSRQVVSAATFRDRELLPARMKLLISLMSLSVASCCIIYANCSF